MKGAVPFRLIVDGGKPMVEWVPSDGGRFDEPFFVDTIARLRRSTVANPQRRLERTAPDALRAITPGLPLAGLIFHVSRCGSTLVTRMLGAVARNLVVSEPQIIDDLLQLGRRDPRLTRSDVIQLLRGAVTALGQPPAGGASQVFVKVDCWHLFALPLLREAFPDVPCLFVYRDPVEVVVSLMQQPSLTLVRDTLSPELLGLTSRARDALSREDYAAAILGAFYRVATEYRALLLPIAYPQLPAAVLESAPGGPYSAAERIQMLRVAQTDAKNPANAFTSDTARKRAEATPAIRAAAAKWALPAYEEWLGTI